MANLGSNQPLTPEQLERSAQARKRGLHAGVTPAQLFGPKLDPILSAKVYREHPELYRALKLEQRYLLHEERRPDNE